MKGRAFHCCEEEGWKLGRETDENRYAIFRILIWRLWSIRILMAEILFLLWMGDRGSRRLLEGVKDWVGGERN
jgi:hypothetical protein